MAAFVILMDADGCFTKKHSIVPTFKNAVSVSQESPLKSLKLADIYLQVMKSIYLILPNY